MNAQDLAEKIVREFEESSGFSSLEASISERQDAVVAAILLANPTNRHYKILNEILELHADDVERFELIVTLKRDTTGNLLTRPEGLQFLENLAESLNVNRYSFGDDFYDRYTKSVTGAEELITTAANNVVFGRRGAGKSMLLLYSYFMRQLNSKASIWIDAQIYSQRDDIDVVSDVLVDILEQYSSISHSTKPLIPILQTLKKKDLSEQKIRRELPSIKRVLSEFVRSGRELYIFIDDFHVIGRTVQPVVLDVIYSIARGNGIFIKLSAIETLTSTYDPSTRKGLEISHDAQVIKLDYNLTAPDKALSHIEAILDAFADFSGIPNVRRMCVSNDVLKRLTWVAAGVPRDALSIFSQAMQKAIKANKKRVSVSNVNQAASETLTIKLKEFETDTSEGAHNEMQQTMNEIREFCIKIKKVNAFLVEINIDDSVYRNIAKLVDLRLLHILNEGVTIGDAGRKYIAVLLDYGFYTGIRAARSVDLFNEQSKQVSYKQLRALKVFRHTPTGLSNQV